MGSSQKAKAQNFKVRVSDPKIMACPDLRMPLKNLKARGLANCLRRNCETLSSETMTGIGHNNMFAFPISHTAAMQKLVVAQSLCYSAYLVLYGKSGNQFTPWRAEYIISIYSGSFKASARHVSKPLHRKCISLALKRGAAKGYSTMKSLKSNCYITFRSLLSDLKVTFCAFPFCGSPFPGQ